MTPSDDFVPSRSEPAPAPVPAWTLVDRVLAGDATSDERAALERALADAPVSAGAFRRLASAFAPRDAARRAQRGAVAWMRIEAALQGQQAGTARAPRRGASLPHARAGWPTPWRMAGGAALLASAVVAVLAGPRLLTAVRGGDRIVREQSYATARAQRAAITLPDGSRATLGPESALRYRVDAAGRRTVTLQGEALFDVTHDPARPFAIQTGAVTTRVLGTSFNVRWYPGDPQVQVAVVSGRVASGARRAIVLGAGHVGMITDSSAAVEPAVTARDVTAWTDGTLVFRDVPVSVMLATVGRWMGYEFRVRDTVLAKKHVSVTLRPERTDETINTLKALLSVTMHFDGSIVTLRPDQVTEKRQPRPTWPARDSFSVQTGEVGK